MKTESKPNQLVMSVLEDSEKPLTAYDILGKLATFGIKGPPTVYRALEKLMKDGLVHRIRSLNAFIACHKETGCTHTHHNTFAVCNGCGKVEEIHDDRVTALIQELTHKQRFAVEQESIELVGRCFACQEAA